MTVLVEVVRLTGAPYGERWSEFLEVGDDLLLQCRTGVVRAGLILRHADDVEEGASKFLGQVVVVVGRVGIITW